jgi:hypothetical protein
LLFHYFKAAILNLGYTYPWGYASSWKGLHIMLKHIKINPQKATKRGLGVRKGVQFWFGGTQWGLILILGYMSKKRLRTPALKLFICKSALICFLTHFRRSDHFYEHFWCSDALKFFRRSFWFSTFFLVFNILFGFWHSFWFLTFWFL